jgi:hypothetical protein
MLAMHHCTTIWHASVRQEVPMGEFDRLPNSFPVGTRYVIEGRNGRVSLHYVEFPDGRKVNLPADLAAQSKTRAQTAQAARIASARASKKNLARRGTARRLPGC